MEKPLTLMLLTLGGFIIGATILAMLFPSITRTGNAIAADRAGFTAQTQEEITVVNAYSELDGTGAWQDTDADTFFDVWIWVKNTGGATVRDIKEMDVFVHASGTAERITYSTDSGAPKPIWSAVVEGSSDWTVGATVKVNVHYAAALSAGDHTLEVVTANGAQALSTFGF